MGSQGPTRVRIASASGSVTDRRHGFSDLAKNENVEFIVGDWLSEYNMTTRGGSKINSKSLSSEFETSFIESIEPALDDLAANGIKVAVNAGASDTKKLHDTLVEIINAKSLNLTVAWVEGDEVYDVVQKALRSGSEFTSLTTGRFNLVRVQISS
jgi:Acyclic terpene utilisation family protein AtuA